MVRCDMCLQPAEFHDITEEKLSLCNSCKTLVLLQIEVKRLNQFWLEKYTSTHETVRKMAHSMNVAIGVRNAKIKELSGKIDKLERLIFDQARAIGLLDERMDTLEDRLSKVEEEADVYNDWDLEVKARLEALEGKK